MYDNEENAVVNNAAKVSETPSDFVSESPSETYTHGSQHGNKLSPNPEGFGFTKQLVVDELPESAEVNTLYLVKVLNNGALIGYRKYKWDAVDGYVQFGATPDLKLEDGERKQEAVEVNPPRRVFANVFDGNVGIVNGDLYINGVKVRPGGGDEEPGDIDNIDSIEFKNVELERGDVGYVATLNLTADQWAKAINQENYPIARFTLTSGDIIELPRIAYYPDTSTVAFGGKVGDTVYYAVLGNSVQLQGQLYEWDEDLEINGTLPSGTEPVILDTLEYKDEYYDIFTANKGIAPEYDSTQTYNEGDIVAYQNYIYKCNTASTTGDWDETKWDAIKVVDELGDKVTANPTLAGTEPELLGVQINNTKYQNVQLSKDDGVTFAFATNTDYTTSDSYSSYNRCGKELSFVVACSIENGGSTTYEIDLGTFSNIPAELFTKLYPTPVGSGSYLEQQVIYAFDDEFTSVAVPLVVVKGVSNSITFRIDTTNLVANTKYHIRHAAVFLTTDNLSRIDPIFANNSWEVIADVAANDDPTRYWSVGDTKTDLGTDGVTRTFRIADMSGLYGKKMVLEWIETMDNNYQWNTLANMDNDNTYNNYSISTIRTTLNTTILGLLSADLQAVLTNTTVKVAKNGMSTTVLEVSDKLFLPAEKEVKTSRSYSVQEEFNALTTWQYYQTNTSNSARIKHNSSNVNKTWWLRSAYSGQSGMVDCVYDNSGSIGYASINDTSASSVSFAFAL